MDLCETRLWGRYHVPQNVFLVVKMGSSPTQHQIQMMIFTSNRYISEIVYYLFIYYYYYHYYYKICIAHKFKHPRVGGAGVAG